MNSKYDILKTSDAAIVDAFMKLSSEVGDNAGTLQFKLTSDSALISAQIANIAENSTLQKIMESKSRICNILKLTFSILNGSVTITRSEVPSPADEIAVALAERSNNVDQVTTIMLAIKSAFLPYEAVANVEKILGKEIAAFYNRREQALLELEGINQKIIQENQDYRKALDKELAQKGTKLEAEFVEKVNSLTEKLALEKDRLQGFENELNEKQKTLDDRSAKHARRGLREDLKKELDTRSGLFSLSTTTINKRKIIHVLFCGLILFLGIVSSAFVQALTSFTGDALSWVFAAKSTIAIVAFVGAVYFYIKWNDDWFIKHAEEEFKMKRLALDIDRASWVYEMALEWIAENGNEMPSEIFVPLTRDLFGSDVRLNKVKRPSEALASKLLEAARGFDIEIPGLGKLSFDRKGISQFGKSASNLEDESKES